MGLDTFLRINCFMKDMKEGNGRGGRSLRKEEEGVKRTAQE